MAVLLIRHAVAKDRDRWRQDDDDRPLTKRGLDQAAALVDTLATFDVGRVLSSPAVRCVDTVRPLADARLLVVECVQALAEGNGSDAAELIAALLVGGDDVALCTHGDVIPDAMELLGFDCHRCAKGSTWVLDGKRVAYLPAP